ncbi:ABC transporter substrate-binding protein [Pseudovibrio exalbescens]|uniref:ABC transporter substrate-binding protein n=1 Tax=Pseudovibrio exalbescens TaxID=197461 RepID=UPI0023661F12|nr:ABC transporter substrate-binding protein [Pseudovibrio exalbescens]MDD7911443.1 ABC transporter substrate-binding protein [Pseudovibrio exalbescens]
MKYLVSASLIVLSSAAMAAECPQITVADAQDLAGKYPQQFELVEFESAANCELTFSQNPEIEELNARIIGNKDLAPVEQRLPEEPLVVAPYQQIGNYGGVLDGMSNATEAGSSDLLSVRHVNLVRFSDDLVTIVPNVAKDYKWNDDYTELTFTLRKGHKWSDGEPFTAHDIAFWYNNMTMDPQVVEKPKDLWSAGGEPIEVIATDDQTVVFKMKAPKPGLLSALATNYAQPFQPKHFLGQFHPAINPEADALAQAAGFENGYEVINFYYGGSDWKDVPSPLLKDASKVEKLPRAVVPTLESHVVVEDTTEGRRVVANPYFHMVDTAGNQLPYINEVNESYVSDNEVRVLKLVNGEMDYKSQSVNLPDAPTLLDGQEKGDYTVELRPTIGLPTFSFNVTSTDDDKRAIFGNKDFRLAMSYAINRDEINSVAYFDLGEPMAYIAFDPAPEFATPEQRKFATEFDPVKAGSMLDAIGLVDKDGDGWRDLPSGKKLTLNMQFSTQGVPTTVAELVAQDWSNVGVQTTIKEVTSDEYRSAQSANELDVLAWTKGQPIPVIQGTAKDFIVPFDDFFGLRNGMLWAQYKDTNGAEGMEPPAWTKELEAKITEWQSLVPGTDASNKVGNEIIQIFHDNFLMIGTVKAPAPIYRSNKLQNFETPKTSSYDYYRTYPYRAQQWFLSE